MVVVCCVGLRPVAGYGLGLRLELVVGPWCRPERGFLGLGKGGALCRKLARCSLISTLVLLGFGQSVLTDWKLGCSGTWRGVLLLAS